MKYWMFIFSFLILACKPDKKYHTSASEMQVKSSTIRGILDFQKELNATFKNPETSPLPDRYRKDFDGLDFFEPDTNYIVMARLERTPDAIPFLLATTTDEKTEEVVYGIAHFELNGIKHKLEVYQTLDLMDTEEYKDYLFLPFLDETNGTETYGGGRYIDLTIPDGNTILIDFNRAYNPYCVYNKKYSCPLVPRQNYLRTNMRAGVKDFKRD
ncbi:DUF1684 domain-containing protein [Flagellimonas aquimarina]|jgi:uncharacterized protein (DUF1684 family)|uniref:DUF1684 domain-containing protein n=1 Tax=Flagellimonas aquimarina TaxID=2201895 RepID=A0A316KZT7_9FLAO|nr:DUF1684 domain-containing protein [Allomuricauda koreensis]PWL38219.1 DUF1684 domain-containing protein [Allomuricauda koreensis]